MTKPPPHQDGSDRPDTAEGPALPAHAVQGTQGTQGTGATVTDTQDAAHDADLEAPRDTPQDTAHDTARDTTRDATAGEATPADPNDRPYLPWRGKATRTDKALMFSILGVLVVMLALWPLRPFLIASAPVALTFVTGSKAATGAVAAFASVGRYPLWLALVAGTVGMAKFDWLFWWTGRQWGQGIVNMFAQGERAQRFASKAHEFNPWILRAAVILSYLPGVPSALIYALAGWTGMRLRTFLLLDAIGALAMTSVVATAGYAAGEHAVDLIVAIDNYAIWISIGIVVAMAYFSARKAGRTARPRSSKEEEEDSPSSQRHRSQ